jgi:hypothetical protein
MPQLSNDEYALIMQSMLDTSAYLKKYPDNPVSQQLSQAIQTFKQTGKANEVPVPLGGSYLYFPFTQSRTS